MTSTFSQNKNLEEPASGDYVNAWATPVNANWTAIDNAFGGTTSISVTGVVPPASIALTTSQYQPPNIEFTGSLAGSLTYYIPAGVGGIWSIFNNTTIVPGTTPLQFGIASGNAISLAYARSFIISDGVSVALAAPSFTSGTFVAQLSAGSGSPVNVNCAYSLIGSVATIWKTDANFVQVTTSNTLPQLLLTGIPLVVRPISSTGQDGGYISAYIGGGYYELASAVGTSGSVNFYTLGITNGYLQRGAVSIPTNTQIGLTTMCLTYPVA